MRSPPCRNGNKGRSPAGSTRGPPHGTGIGLEPTRSPQPQGPRLPRDQGAEDEDVAPPAHTIGWAASDTTLTFSGDSLIGWCHSVSTTVGPARIERAPAPSERAALSVGPRAVETRLGVEPSTTGLQPASHASEMRAALPAGLEPAISAFARQRPIRLDHESRSAPGRTRTSVWGTRFTVWGSRRCATDAWGDRRDSNPLRPASRAGSSPLRIRPPWAARDSNPQPSGCGPDALPLS